MRLWLGLVTVLVFLLCDKWVAGAGYVHTKPEPCPENTVCLIFSDIYCDVQGVKFEDVDKSILQGYVWEKSGSPRCLKDPDFYGLYAKLDIEPLNLYKWKVTATLLEKYEEKNVKEELKLDQYRFNFDGKLELTFASGDGGETNKAKAKLEWSSNGNDIRTSDNSLEQKDGLVSYDTAQFLFIHLKTNHQTEFVVFTFEFELNEEKVLDYVGPVVNLEITDPHGRKYLLKDAAFPEKLSRLTQCDVSEIKEVCYDSCDKIFSDSDSNSDSNSTHPTPEHAKSPTTGIRATNCPSTIWFHSPSEAGMSRKWKKVDGQLKCHMGWFQGNTTSGTQNIKPSMEVQCSAAEPPSMTSLAKIVIGVSAGVGGLVIVVLIVVVCVLMKRKRNHEMGGNTGKNFTLRDSDSKSKAQTPVGMTKSTEREKN